MPPPVRPPRPAVVTAASGLLLGTVAVLLLLVGVAVRHAMDLDAAIDRAVLAVPHADPAEVTAQRRNNLFAAALVATPFLLTALGLAAAVVPLRRGVNAARVTVFVAGGAQLLWCVAPIGALALLTPLSVVPGRADQGAATGPDPAFVRTLHAGNRDRFEELLVEVFVLGLPVVVLLLGTVVALLAVPPANRWFAGRWPGPPSAGRVVPGRYRPVDPSGDRSPRDRR